MWLSELIKICMVVLSEIGRELVRTRRDYGIAGSGVDHSQSKESSAVAGVLLMCMFCAEAWVFELNFPVGCSIGVGIMRAGNYTLATLGLWHGWVVGRARTILARCVRQ